MQNGLSPRAHSLAGAAAFGQIAADYSRLRALHPRIPARRVVEFIKTEPGVTFEQFNCRHSWSFSGTAYGGDDESYHGEGRCYCSRCGVDGDA